jgi:hypothetical protein
LSSLYKKEYIAKKEYAARKEIHSQKKGAKEGEHIKATQKRRGYIRRAKFDFEFLLFLIYFTFYFFLYVCTQSGFLIDKRKNC